MVDDAKDHHLVRKCLETIWEELKSIFSGMLKPQLLLCFYTKSIDLLPLNDQVNHVGKHLRQLIKNFSILRCAMWRWKTENETNDVSLLSTDILTRVVDQCLGNFMRSYILS